MNFNEISGRVKGLVHVGDHIDSDCQFSFYVT